MLKLFLVIELLLCSGASVADSPAAAPTEKSYSEGLAFYSESTQSIVNLSITFPPRYTREVNYPVAIFLHGRGGDEFDFRHLGGEESLDQISQETKTPFIVVAVKQPAHSYWKNGGNFGTAKMVTEDLLAFLEKSGLGVFPRYRGLFGISMGGHGAIYLSQIAPKKFRAIYAISPVFRTYETILPEDKIIYTSKYAFDSENPVYLYQTKGIKPLPGVIEMGRDDSFLQSEPDTLRFLQLLQRQEKSLSVDLSREGAHDSAYWKPAIKRALEFFAKEFSSPSR